MQSPSANRDISENAQLGTRLDCWKEIAAYLGKGERTVKRWEKERGLPTHRVPGSGRASVYAYTAELDEWLTSRKVDESDTFAEEPEDPQADEVPGPAVAMLDFAAAPVAPIPDPVPFPRRNYGVWLAAACVLLLAFLFFYPRVILSGPSRLSALKFPRRFSKTLPKAAAPALPVVSIGQQAVARDLYLKGRYQWSQRTPDSLDRALDLFTQSVVHDPGYAPAYAGLADTYDLLREYSTMPERDAYARAIAAARKAVELDDSLAEGHRALGFAEMWGSWDFVDAEKQFRRAIELNPKDPLAHKWYGTAIGVPGRYDEALEQLDKAQELDPTSNAILADKGLILFMAGRQEEGIALLREVERTAPDFRAPHFHLMLISFDRQDYPMYLAEGRKAAEGSNDPVLKDSIAAAQAGFARGGERELLNRLYAKQREYYRAGKLSGTVLAKTCIQMGRKQEALQLLEEAYAHHEPSVLACVSSPGLLKLKDEPRYTAILRKINFPTTPSRSLSNTASMAGDAPLDLPLSR
jgi:tetratricopeptide (TPR) repeat protein